MKRIGRVLAVFTLVAMFVPAFVQTASAAKACDPTSPPYPSCEPSVIVDNTNPSAGDQVGVSGSNWCPDTTVEIFLDGTSLGTAVVDASGSFSTSITIPAGTAPGSHVITVEGLGGGTTCSPRTQSRTITVAGGGAAGGGNLPFTGSNISAGMLILFALIVVGGISLVAGRRRDAHVKE